MAASVELLQAGCWLVVLLVIAFLSIDFLGKKNIKYPPLIKGWIPWLGCAIDFGKAPLNFIKESWQKHGAVFTFYAAGQRMTFLTDTSDFPLFFNSPQADFQRAVEEAVKNTAGINKHNFFANHRKIHDLVKGRLSSSNLQKLAPKVGRQLDKYISNGMFNLLSGKLNTVHFEQHSMGIPSAWCDTRDTLPVIEFENDIKICMGCFNIFNIFYFFSV